MKKLILAAVLTATSLPVSANTYSFERDYYAELLVKAAAMDVVAVSACEQTGLTDAVLGPGLTFDFSLMISKLMDQGLSEALLELWVDEAREEAITRFQTETEEESKARCEAIDFKFNRAHGG